MTNHRFLSELDKLERWVLSITYTDWSEVIPPTDVDVIASLYALDFPDNVLQRWLLQQWYIETSFVVVIKILQSPAHRINIFLAHRRLD